MRARVHQQLYSPFSILPCDPTLICKKAKHILKTVSHIYFAGDIMNDTTQHDAQAEELLLFRESVRHFIKTEVTTHYNDWEKAKITPRELWNKFGEAGLLGIDTPESHGGVGAPFPFSAVIPDELARSGAASLATNISIHSDIVMPYIQHLGSDEQKNKWLPKMLTGFHCRQRTLRKGFHH